MTVVSVPLHEVMRLMRLNSPKQLDCFVEIRDNRVVGVNPIWVGGPFREGLDGA